MAREDNYTDLGCANSWPDGEEPDLYKRHVALGHRWKDDRRVAIGRAIYRMICDKCEIKWRVDESD
jgi:RNase P subunit RPR2